MGRDRNDISTVFVTKNLFKGIFFCSVLYIGIGSSLFTSCGNNANKANILPPDVQYMADTMFSHNRRYIVAEMDSICQKEMASLISRARDSLVNLEKIHIQNIIGDE